MSFLDGSILAGAIVVGVLLFCVIRFGSHFRTKLAVGDEVHIYGGYSDNSEWLHGKRSVAVVTKFIPVAGGMVVLATLMDLQVADIGTHRLLLYSRFDRVWRSSGVVHVEAVDDSTPISSTVKPARLGSWVESHARYEVSRRMPT